MPYPLIVRTNRGTPQGRLVMFRRTLILTLFVGSVLCVSGQTPSPSPPDQNVVMISTTLIQLDVTVTDKKGNPVTDLRQDEIEIYENGEKQEITNFSFISVKPDRPPSESEDLPETRRRIDRADVRRTIALVVDDLTLSFESTHFVRRALTDFVENQMQEGDLVAIIRTGGGIGALQQFTTSKAQLLAAIKRIRWNLTGLGNVGAFAPISPDLSSDIPDLSASTRDPNSDPRIPGAISSDENVDTAITKESIEELREDVFVAGTLGAVRYLARGMREMPGRKFVMLFSDGFRLTRPNSDGFLENTRIVNQLRLLIDTCNRANVVVYTMDARGLQPAGFTAQDDLSFLNANEIAQLLAQRRGALFDTQEGLVFLARETGGIPFRNTNDLAGGIKKMLRDQSYYLVGYQPAGETFEAERHRFNNVDIKVKRKDVEVRYRSGFFAVPDDERVAALSSADKGELGLLTALSSPFSRNDLELNMHGIFKGPSKKEMTIDTFLHLDLSGISASKKPDGNVFAEFEIVILNFGDNGVPTGGLDKTVTIDIPAEEYDELLRDGLVYAVAFPIKKPGAYQLRAGVRDRATNKIGSASQFILVPDIGKKRLMLTGLVVDNITYETWNRTAGTGGVKIQAGKSERTRTANQFSDTALRRFRAGTVLVFALEAYNVRAVRSGDLRLRTRLIKDGKVIYSGDESPVDLASAKEGNKVNIQGALNLATGMEPGDYAIQVILTDNEAKKKKYRIASQFLQFEIVD